MRRTVFAFFVLLLINSMVWAGGGGEKRDDLPGIYYGVIPAADCPGIAVVVILNTAGQYKITYQYIDRSTEVLTYTGTFSYDEKTKTITLDGKDSPSYYKAGKNSLTQLDMEGKEITGQLAEKYRLSKVKFADN